MSEELYEKDHGLVDEARDRTGLYKLGFEKESFLGFTLPWIIVFGVGGILGVLIWQWL